MALGTRGRRRAGVAVIALSLSLATVMSLASTVDGATTTNLWRARIGTGGVNGTATLQAYASGTGSIVLKLAGLRANTYLTVTLSKGTCTSVGTTLIRFPAIRTSSLGTASRTSSLTANQSTLIKTSTKGTGRVAIRVGSAASGGVRCGVFAAVPVSIGIVLPSQLRGSPWVQFPDLLKTTGYFSQLLYSQDAATERAAVENLIGRGMKALIICPQDGRTAAAAADRARAAGVKVISYFRPILDTAAVDYFLSHDVPAVGAAQARYLIDRAGATKGNNLYLYAGAPADANSFGFLEGAWETLQPRIADGTFVIRNSSVAVGLQANPTLTRTQQAAIVDQVTTQWDYATATTLAAGNLETVPPSAKGTVFVLAPNDTTARAIAGAFGADPAVTRAYITGQDAEKESIQAIIDGWQGMTVFKDPRALVDATVATAVAFVKGSPPAAPTTFDNGTIDVPASLLPGIPVTRDDIQAVLIDTGYYRASDFTGSWPGKP